MTPGINRGFHEQYRMLPQTKIGVAATLTYQLEAVSQVALLDNDEMGDDATVTLPDVAEAIGCTISIKLWSLQSGKTVTIAARGTPFNWSNLTLDAARDSVLLFGDGSEWYIIAETYE